MTNPNNLLPHLPPHFWAHVLEWVRLEDVRDCCFLIPCFWNEVAPRIKLLTLETTSDIMAFAMTRRFPNVEKINIKSMPLVVEDVHSVPRKLCRGLADRLATFLFSFPRLHHVQIDWRVHDCMAQILPVEGYDKHDFSAPLVDTLCVEYRTGQIDPSVLVEGLIPMRGHPRCRFNRKRRIGRCSVCRRLWDSLPPQQLLEGLHGTPRCMSVEEQMQLAWDRVLLSQQQQQPGALLAQTHLDAIVMRQFHEQNFHNDRRNPSPVDFSGATLQRMEWLLQRGATLNRSNIRELLLRQSKRKRPRFVDVELLSKLCEWNFQIAEDEFVALVGYQELSSPRLEISKATWLP